MPKYKEKSSQKKTQLAVIVGIIILVLLIPLIFFRTNKTSTTPMETYKTSEKINRSSLVLAEPGEWLTYTSEDGDYSIQYPPNWEPVDVHSSSAGFGFKLKSPEESQVQLLIGVSLFFNTDNASLDEVVELRKSRAEADVYAKNIQINELLVNDVRAVEIIGGIDRFRTAEIVLLKNETFYTLWATPVDPDHPGWNQWADPMTQLLRAMAETFQESE